MGSIGVVLVLLLMSVTIKLSGGALSKGTMIGAMVTGIVAMSEAANCLVPTALEVVLLEALVDLRDRWPIRSNISIRAAAFNACIWSILLLLLLISARRLSLLLFMLLFKLLNMACMTSMMEGVAIVGSSSDIMMLVEVGLLL